MRKVHGESSERLHHDHLSPRSLCRRKKKEFPTEEMICGKKPVTNENHGFISEKYVSGSSSIRLLVQMFQLEKDRQNGRKCLFLSLSEQVSTVRQTEHSMNYSRPGVALFF